MKTIHDSDCAIYNEPALPKGPCNCGVEQDYVKSLELRLEYCYRTIHFGFTFGVFDFSILKDEATKFVINKDVANAQPL